MRQDCVLKQYKLSYTLVGRANPRRTSGAFIIQGLPLGGAGNSKKSIARETHRGAYF